MISPTLKLPMFHVEQNIETSNVWAGDTAGETTGVDGSNLEPKLSSVDCPCGLSVMSAFVRAGKVSVLYSTQQGKCCSNTLQRAFVIISHLGRFNISGRPWPRG